MPATEFNFDGLVGPTHNYAGLSHGNVASTSHQHAVSSPKQAALQGLQKMKFVRDLGVEQCVLPPLHRPNLQLLQAIGFSGSDSQMIDRAWRTDPVLLAACYSASNMWTANAATVSPASDCDDGRTHLTPANLINNLHRSIEATDTTRILASIFADGDRFCIHKPLPPTAAMSDEGAANHTRFCDSFSNPGVEFFVYGCTAFDPNSPRPKNFPARQTLDASQTIARRHGLGNDRCVFAQQNPKAIDAGVFHNDVISVGNQNVLLAHELAFLNQSETLNQLQIAFESLTQQQLHIVQLSSNELPIEDAVSSYLFNSQLLTLPNGNMTLVCPSECESNVRAKACIDRIISEENPISDVHFLDLRQSMNNGGGPACLRLRVVLDEDAQRTFHQKVRLTDGLFDELNSWVQRNYRDQLSPDDLRDPNLIEETARATDELEKLLDLPIRPAGDLRAQ